MWKPVIEKGNEFYENGIYECVDEERVVKSRIKCVVL